MKKLLLTTVLLGVSVLFNVKAFASNIPQCEDVEDSLHQILDNRTKEVGIDFTLKKILRVREVEENKQGEDVRTCYALLQTETYNKLEILYDIWVKGKQFFVEITDANPIIDDETLSKTQEHLQNQMAESKLQEFEMAKKYGDMKEACMSLRVAKSFFLNAKNEDQYKHVNELLKKENCQ